MGTPAVGEREPIPVAKYPQKCFACPFNGVGLCEHARQRPDPAFKVERRPGGQIFVFRG
jgi:hypothetical protein